VIVSYGSSLGQTLGEAYSTARAMLRERFQGRPFATPDLDARLLVAAACGVGEHAPLLERERAVTCANQNKINGFIERRCRGEPVARILGEKAFWGLDFIINEHTLLPRPETEGIVEEVLRWADENCRRGDALRIVDIGTGSGAIVIALLKELSHAVGFGVDICEPALHVAMQNAARHRVDARFLPVLSNYGEALGGRFDIIVSNPPYIALDERDQISVDVIGYDPHQALFSGSDGLDALRIILPWCHAHLASGGCCVLEHGATQDATVCALAEKSGFRQGERVLDMAKLPRFLKIARN